MAEYDDFDLEDYRDRPVDAKEIDAQAAIGNFFEQNREKVYFSRQVEVLHEDVFFHWVSNRAIRDLVEEGKILGETRKLSTGAEIHFLWHRRYRFYKRSAKRLIELVEKYADPNIGTALGLHGEMMVLAGFAKSQFVMRGCNTREFNGTVWTETGHDLDFIFERDSVSYGVEVKNMLGYMEYGEFTVKIRLCQHLGLRPVFVARMLPKTWIKGLIDKGGYAMVLKYQLYPWTHREIATQVARELGLPVDAPRALADRTMEKFNRWHEKNV